MILERKGERMAEKVFGRYVKEGVMKMTDEEICELGSSTVGILYGFNNYDTDIRHVNELKEIINKEYPDIKEEKMNIWTISAADSMRRANTMMVRIAIPVEDFIRLRQEGQIEEL